MGRLAPISVPVGVRCGGKHEDTRILCCNRIFGDTKKFSWYTSELEAIDDDTQQG